MDNLLVISLSDSMGGAEQCLQLIAETVNSKMMFLKKSTQNSLTLLNAEKAEFLTTSSLIMGFMMLPAALFKYRKNYTIISSQTYLNGFLGILKRIGYLKSELIVRESTSVFLRFTGAKKAAYQLAYQLGYPAVKTVICQTEVMRSQLLEHNGFLDNDKVITLPNPINLANVVNKANECLEDVPADYICAAGRLISIKGFDILIKAFKEVTPIYPGLKLMILGTGPERENLLSLISQLGLQEQVLLKGHRINPYPYFKKARVCVVSSIREGFPNVLLQMMAVNTAVVSTRCAGGIDDITGVVLADVNNVASLANGLASALSLHTTTYRAGFDNYLLQRTPENFLKVLFPN